MPIWPLRSRQPKLQDEALADLAEMFLSNPDDPTPAASPWIRHPATTRSRAFGRWTTTSRACALGAPRARR